MDEAAAAEQRALYGTTLAERFGDVMESYGLTQRGLAQVLGLSAPMLSQLMSAHRIKIGNPAVYERLVMLEARRGEPDPGRVLDEVRDSTPVLSSQQSVLPALPAMLAGLATAGQLRQVAAHAETLGAPRLADVLSRASLESRQV